MFTAEQLNDHPLPFAKLMGVRFVPLTGAQGWPG